MTPPRHRSPSSKPARATLSLEQILATAVTILDRDGIRGLTLRGLAQELGGGLGSIYWYVAGKDELLELACDSLVGAALARAESDPTAAQGGGTDVERAAADVRRIALALFDQTQQHPWLALQLQVQGAGSPNSLRYWERIGRALAAMGLTARQQFDGSTAVSGYVAGVAAQMAAQDLQADRERSKPEQLGEIVEGWLANDPVEFAWIHSMAEEFRTHDDADQFTAGLDLLLSGLVRQATGESG
ncbi:TetR/AcrR family transcriptional regulator C-terminal domain-containing protein [Nocardioides sp. GXZ039]|uniref:TetR/AcrR family transcriptional regulator C-terminal domain-containing protein n=1 Tax=Nocardioides sp. GXZ039 TaxID=3136018 RepID=UPI0030F470DF